MQRLFVEAAARRGKAVHMVARAHVERRSRVTEALMNQGVATLATLFPYRRSIGGLGDVTGTRLPPLPPTRTRGSGTFPSPGPPVLDSDPSNSNHYVVLPPSLRGFRLGALDASVSALVIHPKRERSVRTRSTRSETRSNTLKRSLKGAEACVADHALADAAR
jgi:hypothetical protein